jgi:transketolase C-terminal domain/subunit
MRATLNNFLTKYKNEDLYFLHADMWPYTDSDYRCLNVGVQEPNMINIALGLSSQGKKVIVYGVVGFNLYKGYEQLKFYRKTLGDNITLINAGANGCYSHLGVGHTLDDDVELMKLLKIPVYQPSTRRSFLSIVCDGIRYNGSRYIQLGWDGCDWE